MHSRIRIQFQQILLNGTNILLLTGHKPHLFYNCILSQPQLTLYLCQSPKVNFFDIFLIYFLNKGQFFQRLFFSLKDTQLLLKQIGYVLEFKQTFYKVFLPLFSLFHCYLHPHSHQISLTPQSWEARGRRNSVSLLSQRTKRQNLLRVDLQVLLWSFPLKARN